MSTVLSDVGVDRGRPGRGSNWPKIGHHPADRADVMLEARKRLLGRGGAVAAVKEVLLRLMLECERSRGTIGAEANGDAALALRTTGEPVLRRFEREQVKRQHAPVHGTPLSPGQCRGDLERGEVERCADCRCEGGGGRQVRSRRAAPSLHERLDLTLVLEALGEAAPAAGLDLDGREGRSRARYRAV